MHPSKMHHSLNDMKQNLSLKITVWLFSVNDFLIINYTQPSKSFCQESDEKIRWRRRKYETGMRQKSLKCIFKKNSQDALEKEVSKKRMIIDFELKRKREREKRKKRMNWIIRQEVKGVILLLFYWYICQDRNNLKSYYRKSSWKVKNRLSFLWRSILWQTCRREVQLQSLLVEILNWTYFWRH